MSVCVKGREGCFNLPTVELGGVLRPRVVKIEREVGVNADAKVVVHDDEE